MEGHYLIPRERPRGETAASIAQPGCIVMPLPSPNVHCEGLYLKAFTP